MLRFVNREFWGGDQWQRKGIFFQVSERSTLGLRQCLQLLQCVAPSLHTTSAPVPAALWFLQQQDSASADDPSNTLPCTARRLAAPFYNSGQEVS